ncbi:DUF488 domain-containing protein [Haloarchaeobius sp. HRN-SO-5]|uniref:DUF488 domain-containing protein n=1 Tax=Haloarchaeobius sp. HRN-SO-5 TaxID=3446118 RepID=UPI003EB8CDBF
MTVPGELTDTYVAAVQHDLVDVGDATLVGVVRRPTAWFSAAVDENVPALGPPAPLLDETKDLAETFKMQGMCDEGAHNAAWDETDFEARYRAHLDADESARDAVSRLAERLRAGEDVALVCFENTNKKRCHRTTLREVLESAVASGR